MAMVWSFELEAVAERLLYPEQLAVTETVYEIVAVLDRFREQIEHKPFESLPM
jgi:hypothetical protein